MKAFITIFILLFVNFHFQILNGQTLPIYCQSNVIRVVDASDKPLQNPFAGGLIFPYFSSMDLNFDGKKDIVLLDRADEKILTFINQSEGGKIKYLYFPYYEKFLPDTLSRFIELQDYNGDGKLDLFDYSTYNGAGIELYKNTTLGSNIGFTRVSDQIQAIDPHDSTLIFNLYITRTDEPTIVDIDGDGDLDVMTFDQLGGAWLELYLNMSMEKYGVPDSLDFEIFDQYWGYFMESTTSSAMTLGKIRTYYYKSPKCLHPHHITGPNDTSYRPVKATPPPKRHIGSTSAAIDLDGDTDYDLLVGDVASANVKMLKNGQHETHKCRDTMTSQVPYYPASHPVKIKAMPGIYYMDVDDDGVKDLIFSPMDESAGDSFQSLHHVWFYKNMGKNDSVMPKFIQDDFLIDQMIQTGGATYPAFLDYDADGDLDLFVVTKGNYFETLYGHDHIFLYRNIGKKDSNVYKLIDTNYLGLYSQGIVGLSIAFGDIDGDGSSDLLLGSKSGNFMYYHNDALPGQPANFKFVTNDLPGVRVRGAFSTAGIVDIDGDSLNDIVAGNSGDTNNGGRLFYFRNIGTKGHPSFKLVTDTFLKIFINNVSGGHFMTPAFGDLAGDGKLDMVLAYDNWSRNTGIYAGRLEFYYDIRNHLSGNIIPKDTMLRYMVNGKPTAIVFKSAGKNLRPAIVDLDGDHKPDLVLGCNRGGLLFYGTNTSVFTLITSDKPTILCKYDTITLDAGSGFDSYSWNTGARTQKIRVFTAGYYSCEVSKGGLTYTANISVINHPHNLTADYTFSRTNLTYTFSPVNTDIDSIYWDFGDGLHSNLMNPVHTYSVPGKYHPCLFIMDHCGDTARICKLIVDIDASNHPVSFQLFPNPANDRLFVLLKNVPATGHYTLKMMDIMGKTIRTDAIVPGNLSNIMLQNVSSGIYQVQVWNEGKIISEKKVIVR